MITIKNCWKSLLVRTNILFVLVACNESREPSSLVGSKWTITEEANFLNEYENCYLDQEIEFVSNDYFVYRSHCFSERPFGVIKIGYYKLQKDSIYFYNEYHSSTAQIKVISASENELNLIGTRFYRDQNNEITFLNHPLTLKR